MALLTHLCLFCESLGFLYRDRLFEVDTEKSELIYPSKSKEFRKNVSSMSLCASYCLRDNAKSFSYNPLNKTCMTYPRPICAGDTAEPDTGAKLYSGVVGSCEEIACSGIYTMKLCNAEIKVKCEHVGGSKWTVIQQRDFINKRIDFDRTWEDYKNGFGDLNSEFWIGNDALHCLTKNGGYRLHITFTSSISADYWANYANFTVDSENDKYQGLFDGYRGTAGNQLSSNRGKFSTKDQDNDMAAMTNCAASNKGGWWYYNNNGHICGTNNLNSMREFKWGGLTGIKTSQMKIKKKALSTGPAQFTSSTG